jgi:small-conductance mechanosensitive channel
MSDWLHSLGLHDLLTPERALSVIRALVILILGLFLARLASASVARVIARRQSAQESMITRRIVFYGLMAMVLTMAMHQLGFRLSVLLGAAGILTVALGFASQTSASNLISGLFLIAERPFVVGDVIRIESVTGQILSIDLLSVKLRTFDNLLVRVPNESIIKSQVTNLTRFPIRRIDVQVGVAYKEDIGKVKDVLFEVADRNPLSLTEPKPLFLFQGYGDSALLLQFSVWATRENYLSLKNAIHQEIKEAFDACGIEIPFPHRTVYTGSVTEPFPVKLVPGVDSPPAPPVEDPDVRDGADAPGR